MNIASYNNYVEANIAMTLLQDEGINCHLQDENTATLINFYGGMRLMVHHSQVERAAEILKTVESEYLKTIECPHCKNHSLEIKMITEDHGKHLPAFIRLFARLFSKDGTTHQVKHYRCTNCKKEFDELPG